MPQQPHASPVSTRSTTAATVAHHVPPDDVPFSSISGIRRRLDDGAVSWQICIGASERTGIAHGPDFRTTLADALADLAKRRPALVE